MAPAAAGRAALTLFFMCDSYMGCDQEFELELDLAEGEADEEATAPADGEEAAVAPMEQDA